MPPDTAGAIPHMSSRLEGGGGLKQQRLKCKLSSLLSECWELNWRSGKQHICKRQEPEGASGVSGACFRVPWNSFSPQQRNPGGFTKQLLKKKKQSSGGVGGEKNSKVFLFEPRGGLTDSFRFLNQHPQKKTTKKKSFQEGEAGICRCVNLIVSCGFKRRFHSVAVKNQCLFYKIKTWINQSDITVNWD